MKTSPQLEKALHDFSLTGKIVPRKENNQYLKLSYRGNGTDISEKWNVKIYTSGSIVTTDQKTLNDITEGNFSAPDTSLEVIQIDDAGFGSAICGVMVGVYDGEKIWTDTVDVKFFQGNLYDKKIYLKEYTSKGLEIIKKLGISPKTHRIEICSGFINSMLKDKLRELGYDVVITDIKGPLQDNLEDLYKGYLKELTGRAMGYDPKELTSAQIAKNYYDTVRWARTNAPHLLKTGWKALQRDL
jgi:hypothetical protein